MKYNGEIAPHVETIVVLEQKGQSIKGVQGFKQDIQVYLCGWAG